LTRDGSLPKTTRRPTKARHADPTVRPSSPAAVGPFSFLFLSLTTRPHRSVALIPFPLTFIPFRASVCVPSRAHAHEWDGRIARPARAPSRCARGLAWGSLQGEMTLLPPEPWHQELRQPLGCGHVALLACAPNLRAEASLPLRRLDRAPTPWTRALLLAFHHLLWGFPQSPVPLPREEKGDTRERRRGVC
jgi:hypothetical protein